MSELIIHIFINKEDLVERKDESGALPPPYLSDGTFLVRFRQACKRGAFLSSFILRLSNDAIMSL